MQNPWTVWWFETDSITGKTQRVYMDFATLQEANRFQDESLERTQIAQVSECQWHHAHAAVKLNLKGQKS